MLILASVAVSTGLNTYKSANVNKFVAQMQLIQKKVDTIVQELRGKTDQEKQDFLLSKYGINITGNTGTNYLSIINKAKDNGEIYQESDASDFIYFTWKDMQDKLEIDNITKEDSFIINFKTREVISINGINSGGYIYYTQYGGNLQGGQALVKHEEDIEIIPDFTFEKTETFGLNANIVIKVTNSSNLILKYKETGSTGEGKISDNHVMNGQTYKIPITKSGNYTIRVTDREGIYFKEREISIQLANSPKLDEGLSPRRADSDTVVINQSDIDNGLWYDYSKNSGEWAYARKSNKTYVWIPRFIYKGNEIKYLKGNSSIPTDNSSDGPNKNGWTMPTQFDTYSGLWVLVTETTSNRNNFKVVSTLTSIISAREKITVL